MSDTIFAHDMLLLREEAATVDVDTGTGEVA